MSCFLSFLNLDDNECVKINDLIIKADRPDIIYG